MDLGERLRHHWPEYLIEAGGIGAFMLSAIGFTVLLEPPASPVHAALPDPFARRALMGLAMATTAISLVSSPFGQRSGAHFNPAFTLAFFRLGKVEPVDAGLYALAQFAGALGGVLVAALALRALATDPGGRFPPPLPRPLPPALGGRLHPDLAPLRGSALGHEHDPRADARLRGGGAGLLVALDLLHGAAARHAAGGGGLRAPARRARRALRQAAPRERATLHLPLRLRRGRLRRRPGWSATT